MSPQVPSIIRILTFIFCISASHFFFPVIHLHNIWEKVAFILDCIIIIISPSPHQPRGCTNTLQFAKHKMDHLRIVLYSNGILSLPSFISKLNTCLLQILSCSKAWCSGTSSICSEELCYTIAWCISKSFRAVRSIVLVVLKPLYLHYTLFQCSTSDKIYPAPMDQ